MNFCSIACFLTAACNKYKIVAFENVASKIQSFEAKIERTGVGVSGNIRSNKGGPRSIESAMSSLTSLVVGKST